MLIFVKQINILVLKVKICLLSVAADIMVVYLIRPIFSLPNLVLALSLPLIGTEGEKVHLSKCKLNKI